MMIANRINGKTLPRWSDIPYPLDNNLPRATDPLAGAWPLFFLKRDRKGNFIDAFDIKDPKYIDFYRELERVRGKMRTLTRHERLIAEYWGEGPATKQWTPIIDRLVDTYDLSPAKAARVLANVQAAVNDAFVVTWYYKYLYDIPRPIQLDRNLATAICTPYFPAYPSGHSVISGAAEAILSYYFPAESCKLKKFAEENSISRLYGGVHFPIDLSEGLKLGRQIGRIIANILKDQEGSEVLISKRNLNADLQPPPYKQAIPYPIRVDKCMQNLLY